MSGLGVSDNPLYDRLVTETGFRPLSATERAIRDFAVAASRAGFPFRLLAQRLTAMFIHAPNIRRRFLMACHREGLSPPSVS